MPILLPEGKQSFRTNAGLPLVGGKLFTYAAGTSTPKATYANSAGTTANANPVVLDARGEATIFWSGSYKVILKDASDNVIWTVDGVSGAESSSADTVVYTPAGTGAVATAVETALRTTVNVTDFMTAAQIADARSGTRALDCSAAVQAAVNHCLANGFDLEVPYLVRLGASVNIDRVVDGAANDNYFSITSTTGGGFAVTGDVVMFSTTLVNGSLPASQMVRWSGVKFEADANTRVAYVLDSNKFLRVLFNDCNFRKIKLLNAPAGRLTQSIYLQNCQARRWAGTFFTSAEATFDLKILGGLWEAGGDAFDLSFPVGCAFMGANIEGMSTYAIKYKGGYALAVHGCYFEQNGNDDANGCSIDGSAGTGASGSEMVSIIGNYFSGDTDTPSKYQVKWGDCVSGVSSGNLCSTSLHSFLSTSRVNVAGDYARTRLSNNNAKSWFRAADSFLYGGTISQEFISGRGGLLKLRSLQNNVESTNGLDIDENGDLQAGGKLIFATDAGIERKVSNVLGPIAGDSFRVGGIAGETLAFNAGTTNGSVATTLGSVGPTGATAGNPQGWLRINVNGTDRFVPYW